MAMKYVAAYLMNVLAGKENPAAEDIQKTIESVGGDVEGDVVAALLSAMQGKTPHEVIAAGMEKLQKIPTGGAAAAAAAPAAAAAAAAGGGGAAAAKEQKKEEPEEEEDGDMGLSLFD
ncbi:60S acidic ribosomal protein P2, putative [Eimeria mitis]|uniref:60S acidic ribosomal protein P2, putative n=1 Tax=Eimeria mitis TaxID=44415 RepID=U6K4S7_9EIME|nr:60S acidic ribosomal protein P2, putative [Eimeria mitis]CDJ32740.1 60S acidic ribosomal protein P2, putative [Eimeria mitis]